MEGGRERLSWTARNANLFAGEESCGWPLRSRRSRRRRPSVTPNPSRSARVRPASIEQGTPIMARSLSAIPDGDRGDGTALLRWLPPARPAVSVDRSPTPHPHHVHDECAGRRRSHAASCVGRVFSDMRATRISPHLLPWRPVERNGWECFERNRLAARLTSHTGSAIAAGLVPCALPVASARSEGAYKCRSPTLHRALRRARRNVLRPVRRGCRPGNLPRPPAPSPETSHHGRPRQGTVSMSVCLNSSAVARMGTL